MKLNYLLLKLQSIIDMGNKITESVIEQFAIELLEASVCAKFV